MIRQRVSLRTPLLAYLVRLLTIVFALAMFWYGLMVVLLAVKVSPRTVNEISGYRSLFHQVSGLRQSDFTTPVELVAGFGGFLLFLLFILLALQELPRPHLARGELTLAEHERGRTILEPRAIERMAELAAGANREVASVRGRLGDGELNVAIAIRRASTVAQTLSEVRDRVHSDLERHGLPNLPVNVTLTGYDRQTKRELS